MLLTDNIYFVQCHSMVEEHEEDIEDWWFKQ
jgi:hypothetical protein